MCLSNSFIIRTIFTQFTLFTYLIFIGNARASSKLENYQSTICFVFFLLHFSMNRNIGKKTTLQI